jgi:hypothetical protein
MKIRTIIAAAVAPLALGGVLLSTTAASAATAPGGHRLVEVTSQSQFEALKDPNGVINYNIDVPASVTNADNLWLDWATINGNVTIEGAVQATGVTFNGNVIVSGPGSEFDFNNFASHITGNLIVTGSSGIYTGAHYNTSFGDWTNYGQSKIDGNFNFQDNTGAMALNGAAPVVVGKNLNYSGNVTPYAGGLEVLGQVNAS